MKTEALRDWLARFPDATHPIVFALRDVIRRAVPDAEETIVWGCLSYHRPEIGGRVKGAVCQIVVRRGEVRLDFIHGARLSKRWVPIRSIPDARRRAVAALIRQAGR